MANPIILESGQVYGHLTVIEFVGDASHLCKCDCGNTCIVKTKQLRNGTVKSCGCKSNNKFIDLTGQKIGEWTVLGKSIKPRYWKCQCSCGTVKDIDGHELRRGATKSCGHSRVVGDLTGKKINEWTVLRRSDKDRHWICQCSCGEIREVHQYSLTSGISKSCGHGITLYTRYKAGDKFNSLTLIRQVEGQLFEFKCDCGKVVQLNINSVVHGNNLSCGCKSTQNRINTLIKMKGDFKTDGKVREPWQIEVLNSKDKFIEYLSSLDKHISRIEVAEKLGVTRTALYEAAKKYDIDLFDYIDARSRGESPKETEVKNFVKAIYTGKVEYNTRSVIAPLELDIYIPDRKLAIEFNGSYWHSDEIKDRKYHQNKTMMCINKGIRLIHVFEYEWDDERQQRILKDIIKGHLIGYSNIIKARNTKVCEISTEQAREFCNKNHLQGYSNSSVNIGCFYNDKIVGVMTFGTPRFNSDYDCEVHRLCFDHDTVVVGGAEKMFKYFLNKYDAKSILSYADLSKFTGLIYKKLGFTLEGITEPDYVWFNVKNYDVLSRYQTQKHKLIKAGLGNEDDTEYSIMSKLDYTRIFNSGNLRYIYEQK